MNTCAVQHIDTLRAADHICIWDKTRWPFRYTHHGVVYTPGKTADEIVIAHVWSPINGFREAQADSSFRLTSLTEFLNDRPLRDMRRVQYNSSFLGDALSRLGEVHRARSDIPPIVLARCNFLLGLGKGHFNILSLNCEHVALWCKTGVVWSKQLFHKVNTRAPYISGKSTHGLQPLETTLSQLRLEAQEKNCRLKALSGKRVYLQVTETKFVKRFGQQLHVVHNDPRSSDMAFRQTPTSFWLHVEHKADNNVQIRLQDATTGEYVCAKSNCLKLMRRRAYHRESLFWFEYTWNGELQSRRNRRWYVGASTRDGLLRTFNTRDSSTLFDIVDAESVEQASAAIDPATVAVDEPTPLPDLPRSSVEGGGWRPREPLAVSMTLPVAVEHVFEAKLLAMRPSLSDDGRGLSITIITATPRL